MTFEFRCDVLNRSSDSRFNLGRNLRMEFLTQRGFNWTYTPRLRRKRASIREGQLHALFLASRPLARPVARHLPRHRAHESRQTSGGANIPSISRNDTIYFGF